MEMGRAPKGFGIRSLLWSSLALSGSALAITPYTCDQARPGTYVVHEENDVFLMVDPTDTNYTQGLRLAFAWNPDCEWKWTKGIASWLEESRIGRARELGETAGSKAATRSTSFGFGQNIFTPHDIGNRELIPDDRPFAGWLYGILKYDYARPALVDGNLVTQRQESFELQAGFVGRLSVAHTAQKFLHREVLTNSTYPWGWRHQLHDEFGVLVRYQHQRRFAHASGHFDIVPDYSVAAGNIQTSAGAGAVARFGWSISGFPTRTIEPSMVPLAMSRMRAHTGEPVEEVVEPCPIPGVIECYGFVGIDTRLVARNIFLDGNTDGDSHSVEKKPFVYDLKAGFRLRFRRLRNLTVNYVHTMRSNEFSPVPMDAPDRGGRHSYGAITFQWDRHD